MTEANEQGVPNPFPYPVEMFTLRAFRMPDKTTKILVFTPALGSLEEVCEENADVANRATSILCAIGILANMKRSQ